MALEPDLLIVGEKITMAMHVVDILSIVMSKAMAKEVELADIALLATLGVDDAVAEPGVLPDLTVGAKVADDADGDAIGVAKALGDIADMSKFGVHMPAHMASDVVGNEVLAICAVIAKEKLGEMFTEFGDKEFDKELGKDIDKDGDKND